MRNPELPKEKLRECIRCQREANCPKLPSERFLAQTLGYSRSTIVKALNELESEGIIERRVGSGTYIKMQGKEQTPVCLAVVMRNVFYRSDEHFRLIVDAVSEFAQERNISIRIFDGLLEMFSSHPDDNVLLQAIREKSIHGVLIVSRLPLTITSRISLLCPTVAINNIFGDGSEIHCISCDYFRVGFLAGRYLLSKGHRRIAYVTDELSHPESCVELSGFQAVLENAGIELAPTDVLETRRNPGTVNDRVSEFFRHSHYTGCFVRNAAQTGNLMLALKQNRIRCPEDLEIVVSGNYGNTARRNWKLTVIDNRLDEMCRLGLESLIRLQQGKKGAEMNLTLLSPHLADKKIKLTKREGR